MDVKLPVMIIEDEAEILEDVGFEMEQCFDRIKNTEASSTDDDDHTCVRVVTKLHCTDNLEDARKIVKYGNCDFMIADYRVRATRDAAKATGDTLGLLREVKDRGASIPVLGNTAYADSEERADADSLASITIRKSDRNYREKLLSWGEEITRSVWRYKRSLIHGLAALKYTAYAESPIDKQQGLCNARKLFGSVVCRDDLPTDYSKTLSLLVPCILRTSSVPSSRFVLRGISPEFVDILEPVIWGLSKPFFSFEKGALPYLLRLNNCGYELVMRVADEAE